jgi:ABC-type ATPase involved in cell division
MLRLERITKTFPHKENLLKDLNFSLYPKSFSIITGHSGTGKTTILKMIRGEIKPDSGKVLVSGKEVAKLNKSSTIKLRRSISMVYQDSKLLNDRSVVENIALPLRIQGVHGAVLKNRVEELLDLFNLNKIAFTRAGILSGGEKRKIAIARALSTSPQILLADEPTTGLDPVSAKEIIKILIALAEKENISILLATHQPHVISMLNAYDIFEIKKGKLKKHSKTQKYIGANV